MTRGMNHGVIRGQWLATCACVRRFQVKPEAGDTFRNGRDERCEKQWDYRGNTGSPRPCQEAQEVHIKDSMLWEGRSGSSFPELDREHCVGTKAERLSVSMHNEWRMFPWQQTTPSFSFQSLSDWNCCWEWGCILPLKIWKCVESWKKSTNAWRRMKESAIVAIYSGLWCTFFKTNLS